MEKNTYKGLLALSLVFQTLINFFYFLHRTTVMPYSEALSLSLVIYAVCLIVSIGTLTTVYFMTNRDK